MSETVRARQLPAASPQVPVPAVRLAAEGTLPRLMELAPPGTINPSATLYNSTMYLMAALLAIALVANWLVRPVDPRHHVAE